MTGRRAGGAALAAAIFRLAQSLLLALPLIAAAAGGAAAHAVLVESRPADGARLENLPAEVVLRFSEAVQPVTVQVLDGAGRKVAGADAVTAAGDTLRIALPPGLGHGSYVASYRITSADGHPVAGSLVFGVGAAATAAPQAGAAPGAAALATAAAVNRAIHYFALLAAVGGALFTVAVPGREHPLAARLVRGVAGMAGLAAATAIVAVGVSGAQLTGDTAASLTTKAPWAAGLATSLGGSTAAALAGLGLIGAGAVLLRGRAAAAALVAGSLVAPLSLVLTGHAATAAPRIATAPAVYLHGLAAAFWVGSLWPLAVALRSLPAAEAGGLVRRFSRLAIGAVVVLVAAGAVLSLVQLERPAAVLATDYGLIWLAKMALVALLLGLAAVNRRVLTPRLEAGAGAAALRRSIAGELAVVAAIIGATALLGQTPPPRAIDAAGRLSPSLQALHGHSHALPAGETVSVRSGGHAARIEAVPARQGMNRLTVTLSDAQGLPVAAREARVRLALPAAGIEPFERALVPAGDGRFTAETAMPLGGRWQVRIEALVSDFEQIGFAAELNIH